MYAFCVSYSLTQLYVKIFMPALPVSLVLIHFSFVIIIMIFLPNLRLRFAYCVPE